MWNVKLIKQLIDKLGLSKRILLQEYPSLETLARVTTGRRPLVTLLNCSPDKIMDLAFSPEEVRLVSALEGQEIDRLREAAGLVSYFRHYCFAKNLVELGYSDIDERMLEMIILEFPLYNVEYCKDEVRYVVDRLRRKSSKMLELLTRYPICEKTSPLNVLAYMVLDLNLVGIRSVINDFFINFNQDPEGQILRLLTAHIVYVFLPAVSQGSLIVVSGLVAKLIHEYSPSSIIEFHRKTSTSATALALEEALRQYRLVLSRALEALDKSVDMFELPRILEDLQSIEECIKSSLSLSQNFKYFVLMLTPPRSRSTYYVPARYISNIGLLVRVPQSDERLSG